MKIKVEKLIKIADLLDRLGYEDEADFLGEMIDENGEDEIEEDEIEIPQNEYDELMRVQDALEKSLIPDITLS